MFSDETNNFLFHESSLNNYNNFLFNNPHPISHTMAPNSSSLEAQQIPKKPPSKKDRHTKICTSQGLRDRRVRLSINIARQFFNLQDLLGFDKASKTLGWLLSKSKQAIDELAANNSSPAQNKCIDHWIPEVEEINKKGEIFTRRAKARDRARERTLNKKKMMIMIRDTHLSHHHSDHQVYSRLGDYHHHHHHQEGFYNSHYNNDYYPIINLSTEFHINGKPWDNLCNQINQQAMKWD